MITTDVNRCENVFSAAGRHRPQRGCLHPSSSDKRVFSRGDPGLVGELVDAIEGVGTLGSLVERGLDATLAFLDAGEQIADPACKRDRELLIRPAAQLLIIYVTDEDDCSHDDDAPRSPFTKRSEICGVDGDFINRVNGEACYSNVAALLPVEEFAASLRALKGPKREADVFVAVVGGVRATPDGDAARTCTSAGDELTCRPPESLFDAVGVDCPACCQADAATRYMELSAALGGPVGGGSCGDSYAPALARALLAALRQSER